MTDPEEVFYGDLIRLHDRVVNSRDGASPGVINPGALEAAAARPYGGFGGVEFFPTHFVKAAALMESVSQRHAFVDGNKRTGLLAAALLLGRAGYDLEFSEQESVDVTVGVAEHRLDMEDLAQWLENHAVAFDEEE